MVLKCALHCSLPCPQGGAVSYTASTPALGLVMDRGLGQETVILTGSLVLLARCPSHSMSDCLSLLLF